jgi:hypothetical protein
MSMKSENLILMITAGVRLSRKPKIHCQPSCLHYEVTRLANEGNSSPREGEIELHVPNKLSRQ